MGTYSQEKVYVTTTEKAPYVYDPNDGMYYVYNVVDKPWKGTENNGLTPSQDFANSEELNITPSWVRFESYDALFTKIGIIANGMIGSAVFNNEFMFSQQGINIKGNKCNYSSIDPENSGETVSFLSGYEYDEEGEKDENGNPTGRFWKYKEKENETEKYITDNDVNPYEEKDGIPIHSFRPNVCINFATGQMWLAGGKAVFGQAGDGKTNISTLDDLEAGFNAINNTINSIKYGGLNLIGRVSMDLKNSAYFSNEIDEEKLFNEEVRKITKINNNTTQIVSYSNFSLKKGISYVASVYIKNENTAEDEKDFGSIAFVHNGNFLSKSSQTSKSEEWEQIHIVFTPDKDFAIGEINLIVSPNYKNKGVTYASCLKLQEGNRPTEGFEASNLDIQEAKKETQDVISGINTLNDNLTKALSDGYIDKTEQETLKQNLKTIETDMSELETEKNDIINNDFISESYKTDIDESYTALTEAYNNYKQYLSALTKINF
jgi:hypothetical protein